MVNEEVKTTKVNKFNKFSGTSLQILLAIALIEFILIILSVIQGETYKQGLHNFKIVTILVFLSLIFLVVAHTMINFSVVQRLNTILSLFFAWIILKIITLSTHNFVLLIVFAIVAPSIYWYYLKFGEILTYFNNRYVIFIFRRLLALIPLFISLSLFTFYLTYAIGDPVRAMIGIQRFNVETQIAAMTRKFGLDRPLYVQYLEWVWGFIHGDMGTSFTTLGPVNDGFNDYLWETLKLQIAALIFAFVISVFLGVAAAYYHNTAIDSSVSAIALFGLSMPIFVTGIILILMFGGRGLGWFPSSGAHDLSIYLPDRKPSEMWEEDILHNFYKITWWIMFIRDSSIYFFDSVEHIILPLLTLAFAQTATYARLTRASMLEILRQDFILAARANGLSEREVIWKHAFRNVLLPLITFLGLNVGGLLAGAPITETVFTWPGLGVYFLSKLGKLDFPVIISITMVITVMILLSNLITDIVYTFVDPRVTI